MPASTLKLLIEVPLAGNNSWQYHEIFNRWAQHDPAAAFAGALKLRNNNSRENALQGVFEAWINFDDDALLAAVMRQPEAELESAIDRLTKIAATIVN